MKAIAARCLAAFATLLSAGAAAPAASIDAKLQLCASCHGRNGLPSDQTIPIIWGQQRAYLQKELNDYRNGDRDNQIMSSIAESLSDSDISQIASYFGQAKWPDQAKMSLPAVPAAIATCRTCHNADLKGGMSPAGITPRLAGQFSAYLVNTMTAYADGERANSSQMPALMQSLSSVDRKTIADYLAAIR